MYIENEDNLELIQKFLPQYLTPKQTEDLMSNVRKYFPFSTDPGLIYTKSLDSDIYYQGDGMKDIPFSIFHNGKFITSYLTGIIMSNTCDISTDNSRLDTPNIQYAAIFSLAEYIEILNEKDISEERINSFKAALKENRITNLFYLPKWSNGSSILEESFIRFDQNVTLPSGIFHKEDSTYDKKYAPKGDRLFSFQNYGFYLFLIKLSIHYSRFQEGVFRTI